MTTWLTQSQLHQWGFYGQVLILVALSFLAGSVLAGGLVRVAVRRTDGGLTADRGQPDPLGGVQDGEAR